MGRRAACDRRKALSAGDGIRELYNNHCADSPHVMEFFDRHIFWVKDKSPQWKYRSVAQAPEAEIHAMLAGILSGSAHPAFAESVCYESAARPDQAEGGAVPLLIRRQLSVSGCSACLPVVAFLLCMTVVKYPLSKLSCQAQHKPAKYRDCW